MEWSSWQVAAAASRFDGGRDYRRDTAPATVDELRRTDTRPAGAAFGAVEETRWSEGAAPAGVELDWGGRVVYRPQVRVADAARAAAVRDSLDPGLLPEDAGGGAGAGARGKRHVEYNINLHSAPASRPSRTPAESDADPRSLHAQATFQTGPGGDPSGRSWKSTTRSMLESEVDADTRAPRDRRVLHITPASAATTTTMMTGSAVASALGGPRTGSDPDAYGLGAPIRRAAASSLLAGLGDKLISSASLRPLSSASAASRVPAASSSSSVSASAAAPEDALRTREYGRAPFRSSDPVEAAFVTTVGAARGSDPRAHVMAKENYRETTVGYTGKIAHSTPVVGARDSFYYRRR